MKFILLFIPSLFTFGLIIPKKYKSSINPIDDLVQIDIAKVSMISNNWMHNIIQINDDFKSINSELKHLPIIFKINKLEQSFQEERTPNDIYYAWMPVSYYGPKDILFIITCQYINNKHVIKQVIQSPFWYSEQIESIELKKTLETLENLDLNFFYENDIRYKFSWVNWNL
jgi:hypothetical protein